MPEPAISQVIGTATWTKVDRQPRFPRETPDYIINSSVFTLTRVVHWAISTSPAYYTVDTPTKVTVVTGYSRAQQVAFTQSLGASAGASGFGLSASVKAALSITDTTTQQWHEETTVEIDKIYKGGFTYVTWNLIDSLHLIKNEQFSGRCCATTHVQAETTLDILQSTYEDAAPDADLQSIFVGQVSRITSPSSSQFGSSSVP
jgi:hypothetical protein